MLRLARRSAPLALAAALALTASAEAATVLGHAAPPAGPCAPAVEMQLRTWDTTNSMVVPAGGVLTSWSTYTGTTAGQSAALRVLGTPGNGGMYPVLWRGATHALLTDRLVTVPERVTVHEGDRIAFWHATDTSCARLTGSAYDVVPISTLDPPVGGEINYMGLSISGGRIDLSATIEPDADGDGYGDETQDACPQQAALHDRACPDVVVTSAVDHAAASVGDMVTVTTTVRDLAASPARATTLATALPAGLTFVSATPSAGSCAGAAVVSCSLGDLSPGKAATLTVQARAAESGLATVTTTATSDGAEQQPADNQASVATLVTGAAAGPQSPPAQPEAGRLVVAGGTAAVTGRTAAVRVRCSGGPCRGTLTLRAGRQRTKAVAYALDAGASATLRVSLPARLAATLRRRHAVRVTATAGATVARVTLRAPRAGSPRPPRR
jgi:uncharacterized repeat protein (TIGR01451 family)